jgi:serine/threonine-protein kinase HipA
MYTDATPLFIAAPMIRLSNRWSSGAAGDLGRWANASNLISQAQRFLLAPAAARRIIDDMEAVVRSRWYDIARAAGVSNSDCTAIAGAFAYPGFRA